MVYKESAMKNRLTTMAVLLCSFCITSGLASTITLYKEANKKSGAVKSVSNLRGLIPIFRPKAGDWVKVGDPVDGAVGWVNLAALGTPKPVHSVSESYTTTTITTEENGKAPHTYRVMQYTGPKEMSKAELKKMLLKEETRQAAWEKDFDQQMRGLFSPKPTPIVVITPDLAK